MPAQTQPSPGDRRDGLARMEARAGADDRIGPIEGGLLAVVGLIGGIIVVGGLVLSIVSIAVGDGYIPLFSE